MRLVNTFFGALLVSNVVLALTGCGGGGGSAGSPVPPSNTTLISVSTNVASNTYPTSYTTMASAVNTDVCNINGAIASYPITWNGSHSLPAVTGSPLNSKIIRAVSIKDILPDGSLPTTCPNPDNYTQFQRTAARLKAMNVDAVQFNQWHWAKINPDGSYTVTGDTYAALSDAALTTYIQLARAAGLKIIMNNQIQGFVNSAGVNIATPPGNSQTWSLWLTAFRSYMLNRASKFQQLGVDYWEIGCNACVYSDIGDGSAQAGQLFASTYKVILSDISTIYTGKKFVFPMGWMSSEPGFINGIDILQMGHWSNKTYSAADEASITVNSLKSDYVASGSNFSSQYWPTLGKPMMAGVGIQSRANALSVPGYLEETMCTDGVNQGNSSGTCAQKNTAADFGLQAIVVEAELEDFGAANLPAGSIVMIGDYWQTDFMSADGPTFPNIASSIRNKPAEGIVKQWFAR